MFECRELERTGELSRRSRLSGFTLLEMLVVLVIIGLLVGLVGPRLFSKVDSAKVQTATAQVKLLRGAVETMRLDTNTYPTETQGLGMLTRAPSDQALAARWKGPYLEGPVPLDPWGNPYRYVPPESSSKPFQLYSLGADGKPGGSGNDADIGLEASDFGGETPRK
ncbi:MAG: type II secretion system major pseudopilin GspG [Ramlibacter sp.]|nr:type II secretion system major pseudopilin GspG [Ramlibacter sp.]MBX3658420.1 type II secretion system major pseudopilin GspG [Ramlibacter sp.]